MDSTGMPLSSPLGIGKAIALGVEGSISSGGGLKDLAGSTRRRGRIGQKERWGPTRLPIRLIVTTILLYSSFAVVYFHSCPLPTNAPSTSVFHTDNTSPIESRFPSLIC